MRGPNTYRAKHTLCHTPWSQHTHVHICTTQTHTPMLTNTSSQNSTVRYKLRRNEASHLPTNFTKARSISPKIHSGTPTPRHTCTPSHSTGPGCVPIISTNGPWVTKPLTTHTSLYDTIQLPTLALSKSSLQGPRNSAVSLMASLPQRVRVTGSPLSHAPFGL